MYKKELEDGGRDYRLAIKIPIYMQELGLHNIGVRMNDRVKFINPHGNKQEHAKHFDAMATAWGWNKELSENKKIDYINSLINRGLSKQEAMKYVDGESKISEYVMSNKDSAYIIQAPCILISYGIK
ncbi:hypothetical protein [Candidatus Clostridium stratigraminis]